LEIPGLRERRDLKDQPAQLARKVQRATKGMLEPPDRKERRDPKDLLVK